jgi:cob(I)alamin adenosyltransferase
MRRFFTRTGDDGFTGLLGEGRVPKYDERIESVGTVDEATAALGVARAHCLNENNRTVLLTVQRDLYNLMSEVAATPAAAARFRAIDPARIAWLEAQIEAASQQVGMPKEFIVPGDSQAGAFLSLARATVRRAERRIAELLHSGEIENTQLLRYLNRLSSLCFVLELLENREAGKDTPTLVKE